MRGARTPRSPDFMQLDSETWLARSDGIGVDQKILRLRYGQFLGEEFETRSAPKTSADDIHVHEHAEAKSFNRMLHDPEAVGRADALTAHDHNHSHTSKFGDAGAVISEYGHTHDHAQAATLLDPETKAILKSALGEMWDAELRLRQGQPSEALPFENRALGYIKQVQQASRIYLARVGLEGSSQSAGEQVLAQRLDEEFASTALHRLDRRRHVRLIRNEEDGHVAPFARVPAPTLERMEP